MFQRDEMISRVDHVMSLLQLEELRNRPVRTLSGGQKQLVAIAGILVMNPKIIVFDEATSMLDPHNTVMLHDLMSGGGYDEHGLLGLAFHPGNFIITACFIFIIP